MWTVQERILPQNLVMIMGHRRASETDELHFNAQSRRVWNKDLNAIQEHAVRFARGLVGAILYEKFQSGEKYDFDWTSKTARTDIFAPEGPAWWLQRTATKECKDPRDRVFALISLLPAYEREVLTAIFPDYNLSVERVWLIALSFIRQEHPFSHLRVSRNVDDENIRWELIRKSLPCPVLGKSSWGFKVQYMPQHPTLWRSRIYRARDRFLLPGEKTWAQARIQDLREVAKRPLSFETFPEPF